MRRFFWCYTFWILIQRQIKVKNVWLAIDIYINLHRFLLEYRFVDTLNRRASEKIVIVRRIIYIQFERLWLILCFHMTQYDVNYSIWIRQTSWIIKWVVFVWTLTDIRPPCKMPLILNAPCASAVVTLVVCAVILFSGWDQCTVPFVSMVFRRQFV